MFRPIYEVRLAILPFAFLVLIVTSALGGD